MKQSDYAIDKARINRRVDSSVFEATMRSPVNLLIGLIIATTVGIFYPVSLWIALPIFVFRILFILLES